MADLIERAWIGPFPAEHGGRLLQRGDLADVTEADAESGHWAEPGVVSDTPAASTPAPAPTATWTAPAGDEHADTEADE